MPHQTKYLGAAIRYHRKQHRRSPESVAADAQIGVRTYRRIENDERPVDASELKRICEALTVPVGELVSTTADPLELSLRTEYGARLFSVGAEDGRPASPLLILRADGIDDARAQIASDQGFWALLGWVESDLCLRPEQANSEEVSLWVRDAATTLRPGGLEHDDDDTTLEKLLRVRNNVLSLVAEKEVMLAQEMARR